MESTEMHSMRFQTTEALSAGCEAAPEPALFLCRGLTSQSLRSQPFPIFVKCFLGKSMLMQCLLGISQTLGVLGLPVLRRQSLALGRKLLRHSSRTQVRRGGSLQVHNRGSLFTCDGRSGLPRPCWLLSVFLEYMRPGRQPRPACLFR